MPAMNNELVKQASGVISTPVRDRKIAKQAKSAYDEARMAALKIDGRNAVTAHAITGITDLVRHGQEAAQGDPFLGVIVGELVNEAVRGARTEIRGLYSNWGL